MSSIRIGHFYLYFGSLFTTSTKPYNKDSMKKFKSRRFIIAALFLLMVAAEILLRIFYYEPLKLRAYPLIYRPDTLLGYTYIPNAEAEICVPGISKKFRINRNGFYGPAFEKEKDGKFRIAIVGTSEACGIWLNTDSNFCFKLQQLLDEHHFNAEVLNFSMDGKMRDLNNMNLINAEVTKYHPDLVLFTTSVPFIECSFRRTNYKGYVLNYNGANSQSLKWCKDKIDYIENYHVLKLLYKASYIVRAACRYYYYHTAGSYPFNLKVFVEKKVQAPDIRLLPYSLNKSLGLLKKTQQRLGAINCDFAVYYYKNNEYCTHVLDSSGIKTIALNIDSLDNMTYGYDGHYNERAQRIIAERLFEKLDTVNDRIIVQ